MDLVCIGDLMMDVRVDAGALARGGDVHGRVVLQPGGTSANAAVWAVHAGASARVHGRVGDDVAGRVLRAALAGRGVEDAIIEDTAAPTGTMLVLHEEGERSMVADRGANARMRPEDLPGAIGSGAVLVSGYLLLHADTREAATSALGRAEAPLVAIDAASWPLVKDAGADTFFEDTREASVLLTNAREAEVLCGSSGEGAARALGERYPIVAVKMGARGAAMSFHGELFAQAADHVSEADPTGAGDAFDGVLLARLARGDEPAEALARACRAGGLVAASASTWPERQR